MVYTPSQQGFCLSTERGSNQLVQHKIFAHICSKVNFQFFILKCIRIFQNQMLLKCQQLKQSDCRNINQLGKNILSKAIKLVSSFIRLRSGNTLCLNKPTCCTHQIPNRISVSINSVARSAECHYVNNTCVVLSLAVLVHLNNTVPKST